MDYDASLDALNIKLGDSDDFTFTPEEKQRALTKAWNDSYVVRTVWDTSLTFDQTVYQYTLPATVTTVKDIYLSASNTSADMPDPIDSDMWEVVVGKIQFSQYAGRLIPNGYTLYIKGNYKLDPDTDTLDTVNLQEYVLNVAGIETLNLLGFKRANRFLKNDTSMAELIGLKREFERDLEKNKQMLAKEYENG